MLVGDMEKVYPSTKILVKERVASRLHAKDDTLFNFDEEIRDCAKKFMGWTDLASNPPTPLEEIQDFADKQIEQGIETVILIGQGGSTQAPMTITKYNSVNDSNIVKFRTLDSVSPVRVRGILAEANPRTSLVIVSSKSGGTIEPRLVFSALRNIFSEYLPEEELVKHFVAITDAGSDLERQAIEEGWLKVFSGEASVGGRFSALSVFGLLPAALVGIDLQKFIDHAIEAEKSCSEDSIDNPAINLAAFLYDNYVAGRDKFSFLTPKRGRVLGLWIEQLVAESLGKNGEGILPNIEVDSLMLNEDRGERCVIMYQTQTDLWDERKNFEMSLAYIDNAIPRMNFRVDTVYQLAAHFVLWEYAVALCGWLMKLCPFDQPDVAASKAEVLRILEEGQPEFDFTEEFLNGINMGDVEVLLSDQFKGIDNVYDALKALFLSIKPGDYFALNAFLPFTGEGRREALEEIRHSVAENCKVASCLEVGPRYLHSTGQLYKGGPNTGVFLILSADELKDIPLDSEAESLGALALAQASGDCLVLSERGRRVVHLHLPDNSSVTLRQLVRVIRKVLAEI